MRVTVGGGGGGGEGATGGVSLQEGKEITAMMGLTERQLVTREPTGTDEALGPIIYLSKHL